jgi:poly(beta-D-mannuronate) lyase
MIKQFKHAMYFAAVCLTVGCSFSDAKTHTASTAAQIDSVCRIVAAGDTIVMAGGTWVNQVITFKANGTAAKPILLRSQNYGSVTLTGSSRLKIAGTHLIVEGLKFEGTFTGSGDIIEFRLDSSNPSSYCRLTKTSITNYNPADKTKENKWVSMYGQNNRVDFCSFEGKTNYGATFVVWLAAAPNYHRIDHNYFGPRPPLGDNGGETIRIGTSDWSLYDSFTIVEYNYFDRCNGEIEIISNKSCENTYRYNVFVSCEGNLTLRHGNRCYVYSNYFFCNKAKDSGGIRVIGEDHKVYNNYIENSIGSSMKTGITLTNGVPNSPLNRYFQVKRAVIVFNTLVENKYSINIGAGKDSELSLPPVDCVIANNIVWSTQSPLITYTDTPVNMTYAGNIFYGASLGITKPDGVSLVNPNMSFSPDSLWRIGSTSPAVNAAVGSYPFVTVDIDGQMRTAPYDVGADEYSTEPNVLRPIKKSEVGPAAIITSVQREWNKSETPGHFAMIRNYPNPFNPHTTIEFSVPVSAHVTVSVFNGIGEKIAEVFDGFVEKNTVRRSMVDGSQWATGLYYAEIRYNQNVFVRKMLLLK